MINLTIEEKKSEYETAYKKTEKCSNGLFGDYYIYIDHKGHKIIVIESLYLNQNELATEMILIKRAKTLNHSYLINILDFSFEKKQSTKQIYFILKVYYSFFEMTLAQIKNQNGKFSFNSERLTRFLYNQVDLHSFLQENNVINGEITPDTICLLNNNFLSILRNEDKSPERFQLERVKKKKDIYLSPIMFDSLQKGKTIKIVHNPFKSDIFSLGLIILEFGLEHSIQHIYSSGSLNKQELHELFNRFKVKFNNNSLLYTSLKKMLEFEESLRIDFFILKRVLPDFKIICDYFSSLSAQNQIGYSNSDLNSSVELFLGQDLDSNNQETNKQIKQNQSNTNHQKLDDFTNLDEVESSQFIVNPYLKKSSYVNHKYPLANLNKTPNDCPRNSNQLERTSQKNPPNQNQSTYRKGNYVNLEDFYYKCDLEKEIHKNQPILKTIHQIENKKLTKEKKIKFKKIIIKNKNNFVGQALDPALNKDLNFNSNKFNFIDNNFHSKQNTKIIKPLKSENVFKISLDNNEEKNKIKKENEFIFKEQNIPNKRLRNEAYVGKVTRISYNIREPEKKNLVRYSYKNTTKYNQENIGMTKLVFASNNKREFKEKI